jgi:polysaccharide deacetylase family protein (PEP-CTERM system associated)
VNVLNIVTVDLEEWYHPEYVKNKTLLYKEERIQHSLKITLELLNRQNLKATFFVVGELAEKHPTQLKNIRENDHEIAFHGYYHEPLWNLNPCTLRAEIERFNSIIGEKCIGFRAPSFSLSNKTKWALKILENSGYQYDSSLFPAKTPLYGVWNAPTTPYKPSHENITEKDEHARLWEFPPLVCKFKAIRVPVAGGFYMRFFSVDLIARTIKKLNRKGFPAVIFFHNWELDPETPRLKLGLYKNFITYHKLKETSKRLESLLSRFRFTSIREYIGNYID